MGIDHTVVVDNAGGHLMQRGQVDLVLVGSDRTTARGDVCNKIGTYLKALAAHDNGVPFYVALPLSTIDGANEDGLSEIPIEERDASEVREMVGIGVGSGGAVQRVELFSKESAVANPAFDVTPARYVTQLVTEVGACEASRSGLDRLRGMAEKSGVYAQRPVELAAE
jgi:methylthioribose-1-phosphate isomerase